MALKPCRGCGKDVSTQAATCPHCGIANPTSDGLPPLSLAGKTFVLNGRLPRLTRAQVEKLLQDAGATVCGTPSAKTDYMIAGYHTGNQLGRARTLGLPVLTEGDLLALLGIEDSEIESFIARERAVTDGEYAGPVSAAQRRQQGERACAQLLGLINGITADGYLHDMEIQFLRTWLAEHQDAREHWLGRHITDEIDKVLADGIITDEERAHLLKVLQDAAGSDFVETGSVTAEAVAFPVDRCDVDLKDAVVCLTGKFNFGSRGDCAAATAAAGATLADSVNKTVRYLVIGAAGATKSWKQASYGAKIDAAMKLKEKRHPIYILDEPSWRTALGPI
jgi:NAD-dependent DNA ligase